MLCEDSIRALIVETIFKVSDNCNSYFSNHADGQIRALIAVLNDGVMPPSSYNACDYLRAAQVPFTMVGSQFSIPDEWLDRVGCKVERSITHHPQPARSNKP